MSEKLNNVISFKSDLVYKIREIVRTKQAQGEKISIKSWIEDQVKRGIELESDKPEKT